MVPWRTSGAASELEHRRAAESAGGVSGSAATTAPAQPPRVDRPPRRVDSDAAAAVRPRRSSRMGYGSRSLARKVVPDLREAVRLIGEPAEV